MDGSSKSAPAQHSPAEMEEGLERPFLMLKQNIKVPPTAIQESHCIIVFHLSVLPLLILTRQENQAQYDASWSSLSPATLCCMSKLGGDVTCNAARKKGQHILLLVQSCSFQSVCLSHLFSATNYSFPTWSLCQLARKAVS